MAAILFFALNEGNKQFLISLPVLRVYIAKKILSNRFFNRKACNCLPCWIKKSPEAITVGLKNNFCYIINY
jgi:hypothetical protein